MKSIQKIRERLAGLQDHDVALPPQNGVRLWMNQLRTLLMKLVMTLEQTSWFLQCCPKDQSAVAHRGNPMGAQKMDSCEGDSGDANVAASSQPEHFVQLHLAFPTPLVDDDLPDACKMRQGDAVWKKMTQQVADTLKDVKVAKAEVDEMSQQTSKILLYSW